jgi:hypothetical protein
MSLIFSVLIQFFREPAVAALIFNAPVPAVQRGNAPLPSGNGAPRQKLRRS